ncbi:MAG: alcohol dehydrogenase catalytic domain-containing protein [Actinomycetota bacterium]|nr:alcohol dehydrogenase catalytic domain-containing protein [Actinomycetota bacterium]
MRAVVLRQYGGPDALRLEEVPGPSAADDEILVEVSACGVCGHDLLARQGRLGTPLPAILGHEISGVVSAVGSAVDGFEVGDRVALVQRDPCGQCPQCTSGAENLCRRGRGFYGEDQPGGYAGYVRASARNTVKLPPEIGQDAGAILSCAIGTGWHALRRTGAARGEIVLVTGAGGGVGLHALQLCRHLGMHVIAVTGEDSKRDRLLELGADSVVVLDPRRASLRDEVRRATGGQLADVVLEVAGPPTFSRSLAALAPRGRLALIGNVDPQDVVLAPGLVILKELSVVGSAHGTRADLEAVLELVTAGHVEPLIAEAMPLADAAHAHEAPTQGALGRRVLLPRG